MRSCRRRTEERYEGRQGRSQQNVPDAQVQQGQEDADGFLFVPGQDEGQGQVVDAAAEGCRQGRGDADGAVGVVALAYVQNAGQPGAGHVAQRQVVEPELSAGQR